MKSKLTLLAGVDEAGRGPLAGPVAIGVAIVPRDFDWGLLPGVGDSKKVSPKNREIIFKEAQKLKRKGLLNFAVALVSNTTIDRVNVSGAVRQGINQCFKKLALDPKKTHVKLDGLLRAPDEFISQETIIKGDAKEKVIGLASILAKVTRDRLMVKKAREFPQYGFEIHKGYGTQMHRDAIRRNGMSTLHRVSFCKNIKILGRKKIA